MTDTPPSPLPVPYALDRPDPEILDGSVPAEPQTEGRTATDAPPRRRSMVPFLVGGLAAIVVVLAGAVAVLATRPSSTAQATASPSPSWTSVFGDPTIAAPYSPPPPREVSAAFGETLTLSGTTDEVRFTVVADKTYTKTKFGTKPKNGILYGIKVTVEVIEGGVYAYAGDFALVAADGTVYEGSGFQVDGGLDGVDLNRKQKASGIVVFDVPPNAPKGARIELREGSTNQGFWDVP